MTETEINKLIKMEGIDANKISDGYHTFGELYDHRIALFIVLSNLIYANLGSQIGDPTNMPWKSKVHYDGSAWEGWFVAGIGTKNGKQITYHIPIGKWDDLRVVAYDNAPEWDGHTSQDVINRLKSL